MKTSTYIIITFLVVIFSSTMILPIDSKLHKQEYIAKQNSIAEMRKLLSFDFSADLDEFNIRTSKLKDMSDQNLSNAIYQIGNAIEEFYRVSQHYKNDTILQFIKTMCELQLKQHKLTNYQRYIYANVLFDLELTDEAINQLEIVSSKAPIILGKGYITKEGIEKPHSITYVYVNEAREKLKEYKENYKN